MPQRHMDQVYLKPLIDLLPWLAAQDMDFQRLQIQKVAFTLM